LAGRQQRTDGCPSTGSGTWTAIALAVHSSSAVPYCRRRDTHVTVSVVKWRLEEPGQWQIVVYTQMENATKTSVSQEPGKYRYVRVARRDYDVYCFDSPEPGQDSGPSQTPASASTLPVSPPAPLNIVLQYSNEGAKNSHSPQTPHQLSA
jgi:hypothetical protein